ncbi:MAG: helix-turn-helix domain-containing protein [Chloroflexi bacterium]|nr:helix-turn-helix domain-containing protein [Chloroflexota bacterium]
MDSIFARDADVARITGAAAVAASSGAAEFAGWLTLAEAAERYGLKRERLRRATLKGRLPAHKIGAGKSLPWLVKPEEVERFLRESRRGPKKRGPGRGD